jgi:ParB-like nuclease domain
MNFENRPTHSLRPYPGNARTHSPKQIRQISRSIERFGFNNPVLVDDDNQIIAGHGRVEAAKLLNMKTVPTVRLSHLSDSEKKAYILADNRLAEKAGWDNEVLAIELQGLVDLGFDVLLTGFEPAEVDIIIEGIGDESEQPENLVPEESSGPPVSRLGDVWMLGKHILVCGDSTDSMTYKLLMDDDKAEFVFTDPPYNVKIDGNVSGLGRVRHREFAMASGEMSESQFTAFLSSVYGLLCKYSTDGSIHQICINFQDALLAVIAYREIEERITAIIKKDRKFLWMRRLRWFALSLFRLYIAEKQLDTTEMLGSRSLFQGVFSDFWKEAHRELISAHYDAVDRDKTTVFALARSDTRWSAMRDKFQTFLKQSL